MTEIENDQECVNNCREVFQTCDLPAISIVKLKIIQALIQIERPMNWNYEKLLDTINDLISIEHHNAIGSKTIKQFKFKWKHFENTVDAA